MNIILFTSIQSTVYVLLVVSILRAVTAQNGHNCTWSSRNVTCHDLSTEDGNSLDYLSVSVDNCLDPVGATLVVSDEGGCSWRSYVNGVGESRKQFQLDGWLQLSAVFSRNASHLHFQVVRVQQCVSALEITVEPPNKGHLGSLCPLLRSRG